MNSTQATNPRQNRAPSQSTHSIQPSHLGNTWKDTQTSHSRQPSRHGYTNRTRIHRHSSKVTDASRYSYPIRPSKSNQSRVRIRSGPSLTVTIISNNPIRRAPRYPTSYKISEISYFSYSVNQPGKLPLALDIRRGELGMALWNWLRQANQYSMYPIGGRRIS